MAFSVQNHNFVNHKSEEMICWDCGYVIWRCKTDEEVLNTMKDLEGYAWKCPKKWHGKKLKANG